MRGSGPLRLDVLLVCRVQKFRSLLAIVEPMGKQFGSQQGRRCSFPGLRES